MLQLKRYLYIILLFICVKSQSQTKTNNTLFDTTFKVVHVFVALCDNQYQGIVPVPAAIGNGQNPANNLYWGCSFGIYAYFKNSKEWQVVEREKLNDMKLERLILKHTSKKYYLIADAYNGKYIKQCTKDFLYSCSGQIKDTIHINNNKIGISGNAKLIAYIGHNGLMDFELAESFNNVDEQRRDCIILACVSKKYFAPYIKNAKANPLVWTTGLMCPEAYTLHYALTEYVNEKSLEAIIIQAARAYAKYQKCGEKAAKKLLVQGW